MTSVAQIREFAVTDWPAVIELFDCYDEKRTDGPSHRDRESRWDASAPRFRLVAEDAEGVCGYARTARRGGDVFGRFGVTVYVHPRATGSGLGRELYSQVEQAAVRSDASFLVTVVKDTFPRGIAFAEHSGYRVVQHLFESVLDLETFDPSPYLGLRPRLEDAGYRFFSLAGAGDTEEHRRRLHALDSASDEDTPGVENWGPRTYEQYLRDEFDSFGFSAESIHIASFGDEWVAMNSIRRSRSEGVFDVDYTGVSRDHRGRGLAQALKVIGIAYASGTGAREVSTYNDDRNGPMLAINRKLGFVSKPGFTTMRKDLEK